MVILLGDCVTVYLCAFCEPVTAAYGCHYGWMYDVGGEGKCHSTDEVSSNRWSVESPVFHLLRSPLTACTSPFEFTAECCVTDKKPFVPFFLQIHMEK